VGDIDFEVISVAENSNKFQKIRFWKKKSVESRVFLGRNFVKMKNNNKFKGIFCRRFFEILKKNGPKSRCFELVLPDLEALLMWVTK